VDAALAAHGLPVAGAQLTPHVTVAWACGDHSDRLRALLRSSSGSGSSSSSGSGAHWHARVADVRLRVGGALSLVVW
jgi:hypothetical protein